MYLIGVSKRYTNYKTRRASPTRSGKGKMAYYYDEMLNIFTKKEGYFSYYFKKYFVPKWRLRKFICPECGNIFQGLVTIFRREVDCPYCL